MSAERASAAAPGRVRLPGRPDFAAIAGWIRPGAHVLDLGCADGSLLRFLRETRNVSGYGVEIDDARIIASVRNGVNVIQSDLESGLSEFESGSFDYVILSQTLQAVRHTQRIVKDMLRVGREGIVTFPNFGFWRHRLQILRGRMPVSKHLPYQWYDTPNVHLFTIRDFELFCGEHDLRILERIVMGPDARKISLLRNVLGALAVYRFNSGRRD
jgi:methionine biosynthesis protein MetW